MAQFRVRTTTANSALTAINNDINAGSGPGKLRIYSGTIPATPETAASGTLLAELTLSDPCGSVANKILTFGAITQDSSADASGTAAWFRVLDSDNNAIFDGDVTVTGAGGTLQLNTTNIVALGPVLVTGFSVTVP